MVIGVDLGGTKVAAASLRERELGSPVIQPTDRSAPAALLDQIVALVRDVQRDRPVRGVGIGLASVVDFETGSVVSSVNLPLAHLPLRQLLGKRLGLPVFVDNDATVAALAEAHDEELRMVTANLVMITVGTGIGGGLVLGGRIYRGVTGAAGELGHTLVRERLTGAAAKPGEFPRRGSLEQLAAGRALDRLAEEAAASDSDSPLGRWRAEGKPVFGADAVRAARAGDPLAARAVELWGERVGIGVANAINTFDPDEVVIGGGGAQAGALLLEAVRRVAVAYVLPGVGRRTRIRLARHGVRAGVLGAALLALHELGGPLPGARGVTLREFDAEIDRLVSQDRRSHRGPFSRPRPALRADDGGPTSSLGDRQKEGRVGRLSGFSWGLGEAERTRLRRTMRKLLDRDDTIADRLLILRAIDETWPADARPAAAQRVADFYLERPDVANHPGAYGV